MGGADIYIDPTPSKIFLKINLKLTLLAQQFQLLTAMQHDFS